MGFSLERGVNRDNGSALQHLLFVNEIHRTIE
uniref:Uncharacterized protein n=1 Tax=Arundo donax TaxID=35708 RepID=A0A0A9HYL5_ARUDO